MQTRAQYISMVNKHVYSMRIMAWACDLFDADRGGALVNMLATVGIHNSTIGQSGVNMQMTGYT